MEPFGAAAGAVGLAGLLFEVSLQCYDILSETQDVAAKHDHFTWQLKTEKLRLIRWEERWGLKNGLDRKLGPNNRLYHYAVETLARILSLFTSAENLRTKYGIKAINSSRESREPTKHSFRLSVRTVFWGRSRSPGGRKEEASAPVALPGLDPSEIQVLENPSSLENKALVPGLEEEIERIRVSTEKMKEVLPLYKKLRWAVVDKSRSKELVEKLKEYNDGLEAILPNLYPPQAMSPGSASPTFLKFHVPARLALQRNQNFRGRDDLLAELDIILCPKAGSSGDQAGKTYHRSSGKHRIAVLHGLGGMGKSQIATEFAYRHYSNSAYTSAFWVDATSQVSLAQSSVRMIEQIIAHYQTNLSSSDATIKRISALLGLPGFIKPSGTILENAPSDLVIEAAKRWLSDPENKDWLIIFDNNDDIDSVKLYDFLPRLGFGHGSTIITTRRPELSHMGTGLEIDRIERDAAIRILLTSAGKGSDTMEAGDSDYEEATKISERLGYLPLALDQAGGYIAAKQLPIFNYLPLYNKNFNRVASKSNPGLEERYRKNTLYTTWKISFDSLHNLAAKLLLLCAFLGGVEISEELLLRGKEAIPSLFEGDGLADDAIDPLLSFSLARKKYDTQSVNFKLSFHPLVLEWARESLDVEDRYIYMLRAISLIGKTYKRDLEGDRTMDEWVFGMGILHHINTAMENIQVLLKTKINWEEGEIFSLTRIAEHCGSHGLHKPAINILEGLLYTRLPKSVVEEGPSTQVLDTMTVLALFYSRDGKLDKSHELFKSLIELQRRLLGDEHPDTLEAEVNFYFVLYLLDKEEESLKGLEDLLPKSKKVLGKEHKTTLRAVSIISDCQMILGRGQSVEAQVLIAAKTEERLGRHHPDTLRSLRSLAVSLRFMKRYEESVEAHRQVIEGREKVLGKDHPDTLTSLHDQAASLCGMERYEEAVEVYRQLVEGREKVLEKDHPDTLTSLHDLADSLYDMERYEEAVEVYRQAVEGREKVLGKDHPDTLTSLHNLAASLCGMERYEEGAEIYRQAAEGREKILGKDHPDTLMSLHDLAASLFNMKRYEEAAEVYRQVVEGREKALGKDHPDTLTSLHDLADSLYDMKRDEESAKVYRQVIEGREKALGKDHPDTLKSLHNLAASLHHMKRYEEAAEVCRQVIEGREKALGKDHLDTLKSLHNLAVSLHHMKRYEEAIEVRRQAVEGREKVLGKDHLDTLMSLHNLAVSLYSMKRYEEAAEVYRQLVEGREKVLGKDHPDTLTSLHDLAASLHNMERYEEAAEVYRQVVEGREKVLGKDHPGTLTRLHDLGNSLYGMERYEEAVEVYRQAVEGREKVLGKDHPDTLTGLQWLNYTLTHILGRPKYEGLSETKTELLESAEKMTMEDN